MRAVSFAELQNDFLRITSSVVHCSVATVDVQGAPRARIWHPIFVVDDGSPVGWVFHRRGTIAAAHIERSPQLSCSYWSPAQDVVLINCTAVWVQSADELEAAWNLITTTPRPLGYDLRAFGVTGPDDSGFSVLRLEPWRVQVLLAEHQQAGDYTPRTWHTDRPTSSGGRMPPADRRAHSRRSIVQ